MKLYMKGFVLAPLHEVKGLLEKYGTRELVSRTSTVDEQASERIANGVIPSLAVSYRWRCGDSYNTPIFTNSQLNMLLGPVQAFQMRHGPGATVALWIDKVYHVRTGDVVHNVPWIKQGLRPYYHHEVAILDKCVSDTGTTNFWTMAEHAISYSNMSGGLKLNMKFGMGRFCDHEARSTDFSGSLTRVKTLWSILTSTGGKGRFRDDDGEIAKLLAEQRYDESMLHPSDKHTYIPSANP